MSNDLLSPPSRDWPSDRLVLRKELLLRQIQEIRAEVVQPVPGRRRQPSPRRLAAFVLVPAALIGAGAAYAIMQPPATATVEGVTCFDRDGDGTVVGADGRDPTVVCGELWANGQIEPGVTTAPPLQACTGEHAHYILVYPGDDPNICLERGLPPVPTGYQHAAEQFARMRDEMARRLPDSATCIGRADAMRVARSVLDTNGFRDWSIETKAFGPSRACAEGGVYDSVRKTMTLVGGPGEGGS